MEKQADEKQDGGVDTDRDDRDERVCATQKKTQLRM